MKPVVLAFAAAAWAAPLGAQPHRADTLGRERVLDEVVVTGARYESDARHLPMTVSVVGRGRIEESHKSSILPALNAQVPGFFSTSRGVLGNGVSAGASGQMSLRGIGGPAQAGLPTTGLLVLIDGHPQYMGLMGHPIADACQAMQVERVEVLRGPASALYGSNAMGGVINIVTRRMQEDGARADIDLRAGSYGTFEGEAAGRIRAGRLSGAVAASYSRTDGHRPDMGFEQYGGYAKLGYRLAAHWKLQASLSATHFNASNPGTMGEPYIDNDQRVTRGMASAAVENGYLRASGALSFFYNWGDHWINDGYRPGEQPLDYRFNSNDNMWGLSWYQSVQLFKGNRLTAGVDYFHFGGEAWNQYADGRRETSADKTVDETAGYLDFRQMAGDWLTIDVGARIDHHPQAGTEFIPQAGLAFHLPRRSELKAMASKGFRNPTIREMYMFPPQNPGLAPERVWNYELSFAQRLPEGRLSYGVNLFYLHGDNLILRIPNPDGSGMLNQNSGKIDNCGIELDASCRLSPGWTAQANYSWLHMEHPVLASPEHKLYAGLGYRKGRWDVSTGMQYVKGLYTDVVVAGNGAFRQEDFVLWDARADFRVSRLLSLYVRGENLLAQRYEVVAGYPMPKATFTGGLHVSF